MEEKAKKKGNVTKVIPGKVRKVKIKVVPAGRRRR